MRSSRVVAILLLTAAGSVLAGVETAQPQPQEDRFFTLVLPEAERSAFEALDDSARGSFRSAYWARIDPSPTTEFNELEMEHQRRVVTALRRFRDPSGFFLWGDRARAMIRFGEPDSVVTAPDDSTVATALWVYDDFVFWFLDVAGKGVYEQGLAPLPSGDVEIRFDDGESARAGAADFDARAALDEAFAAGGLTAAEGWRRAAAGASMWIDVTERNTYAPPDRRPVRFVEDAWCFAGDDGTTSVLVGLGIDAAETTRDGLPVRFTGRIALRDSTYSIVARTAAPVAVTGPGVRSDGALVAVDTFAVPPGRYRLVARLDETGEVPGVPRSADLFAPDYSGSSIRVTAPVAAIRISTSFRESGLYARRGFRIVPCPGAVFRHGEAAGFYFEVYHVTADRDGRYYEEVTVRLEAWPGAVYEARFEGSDRGELAPGRDATFGSVGRGPDSGKSIILDTSGMPPGSYALVVEARDLTTGLVDTARTPFSVTE